MTTAFELIGVPFTSMAAPGGIARAIDVLRAEGLTQSLLATGRVNDAGDLPLMLGDPVRGPSGLLNETALTHLVHATRQAAAASHDTDKLPLLIGGDCPVLLGALAATRDHNGTAGLLLIDGHEDAWPPHLSSTGEASDSEVALALGLIDTPLPDSLAPLVPLLTADTIAMLGPRDRHELETEGAHSLADTVAFFRDDQAIHAAQPAQLAHDAATAVLHHANAFWLHIDLDVLATDQLAAIDYPQPGGLTWTQLHRLATAALTTPGCAGASIVIYNPDKDPDDSAAHRIIDFITDLITAVR